MSEIAEVGVAELRSAYRCIGLCKLLDKLCIFFSLSFPNMFSLQWNIHKKLLNISMFYWYFFNLPFQFKA